MAPADRYKRRRDSSEAATGPDLSLEDSLTIDVESPIAIGPEKRVTDPHVVTGISSVDITDPPLELGPRRAEVLTRLDTSEQLEISPDEFDDVWQIGNPDDGSHESEHVPTRFDDTNESHDLQKPVLEIGDGSTSVLGQSEPQTWSTEQLDIEAEDEATTTPERYLPARISGSTWVRIRHRVARGLFWLARWIDPMN